MEYSSLFISIMIFILLIACEIIVYGFYTGITELNEAVLEKDCDDGKRHAGKLLKILEKPMRLYACCGFISTFAGLISGIMIIRQIMFILFGSETIIHISTAGKWAVGVLIVILAVIILLCIGIMVPRYLALNKPEKWAYRLLVPMTFIMAVTYPVIFIADGLAGLIVKLFGVDPNADTDIVTEEELVSLVNEGHEQGIINSNEAEMINNIIEFSDKEAGDIMIHRANVVAFDGDTKLNDAISMILEQGYSRIPVYREVIDDVIGILHLKDAIMFGREEKYLDVPISEIEGLLRPAVFIPETRNISTLLKNMQSKMIHQVVVVDEYGQMAGIITMEDVLEEIVGNIFDEYDENESLISEVGEDYIMSGMTPLEDVFETLGYDEDLADELDYDTLNGFLISILDRIPDENEKLMVSYKNHDFEVLEVKNKMISTVKVVRKAEENVENKEEKV